MQITLITNTWLDATVSKPWRNREVLVKFDDGNKKVARWNGYYWVDQHGMSRLDRFSHVVKFYIYELENEDDNP